MDILINNKTVSIPEYATVTTVLTHANIPAQRGVAVAVNSNVVPCAEWEQYKLKENDKVMIIKATQGG
jgi:sulfur carrier protein